MNILTLRYKYDASFFDPALPQDDFGYLSIVAVSEKFSGEGGFWVQWQDVKEFGEALSAFPILEDHPIVAQWGYNMQEGNDLILRVEIGTANARGDLVVRFEIADYLESGHRVQGLFLTNYPEIDAFRVSIARLMDNEADEATLTGQ